MSTVSPSLETPPVASATLPVIPSRALLSSPRAFVSLRAHGICPVLNRGFFIRDGMQKNLPASDEFVSKCEV